MACIDMVFTCVFTCVCSRVCVCVLQDSSAAPSAQQARTQQAAAAADQGASMARLFSDNDVCETSHHLQITHLDLHICDDIHAKDKGAALPSNAPLHTHTRCED